MLWNFPCSKTDEITFEITFADFAMQRLINHKFKTYCPDWLAQQTTFPAPASSNMTGYSILIIDQ
jgi:hypothetical protein